LGFCLRTTEDSSDQENKEKAYPKITFSHFNMAPFFNFPQFLVAELLEGELLGLEILLTDPLLAD